MLVYFGEVCVVWMLALTMVSAFTSTTRVLAQRNMVLNAEVEIVFPNKKKVMVEKGSKLSDAAKKAGFKPNYACSEGKCGSCELKNGSKKVRPCTAKAVGPMMLTNP